RGTALRASVTSFGGRPRRPPATGRPAKVPRLGNSGQRLTVTAIVLMALFAVAGARVVQIQTTKGDEYAAAAAQSHRRQVVLAAPRGSILDRDGNALARNVRATYVAVDPAYVVDPVATAEVLAGLIGVPASEIVRKISPKTTAAGDAVRFVYLRRGLDPAVGEVVAQTALARRLPGVIVQAEQRREVPGHDLGANLLGFTGWDGTGLAGLEASYDKVLRGVDGERVYDVGAGGQEIPNGYNRVTAARPGSDLALTLDRDLQYETQRLLSAAMRAHRGWTGSAVVMDVRTGEVRAMASYPTYDAADPTSSTPKERIDLATATVVEPGSVHKAVTIGAGLQENVIEPNSVLTLPRSIRKGGITYRDTHHHASPRYTLTGILAQSSNVGTIMVADRLGADRLYAYQRKFGLGSPIGIGLPGESAGIVQPPENWSGPSYGGIPIGLGVAVTPLQMTSVYATIANDGVRLAPTLVRGTVGPDRTFRPADRPAGQRVLSAENARALRLHMEGVAPRFGTAPSAAVRGYRVAGKTGTGLLVRNNKYTAGNVSSFIGMVPADAPRYVISVFVHAQGDQGTQVAGPTFSDLASFTLRHYGVAPTGTAPPRIRVYG
ncbi:MAG TPA: penicillin-binding protein 2, partial [Cryptosporangiaceae bacterium]|nr:penicillin-binding protein 2 [Cryptosporangiaceae bacterium]